MPTINEQLNQLKTDKQTLVNNLVDKGVEATNDETFTELVPKVSEISGDIDEYFIDTYTYNNSIRCGYAGNIKKIPKINTTGLTIFDYMFYNMFNLTEVPDIDTSNATSMYYMFFKCGSLKVIPHMDTSKVEYISNFIGFDSFVEKSLERIEELDLSNAKYIFNIFRAGYAPSFYNLTYLGGFLNLGKNFYSESENYMGHTLSISMCPSLTHESLMNVINKLYDLNLTYDVANGGTLYKQKLELGSTNIAKLTEDEIAIAANKGWNVV